MAVLCTSAGFTGIWWYPVLRSILEKTVQPILGGVVQHVGKRIHIWFCNQVQSPPTPPTPAAFFTMCKGLDQGDVER
jgi:hypothetical protein